MGAVEDASKEPGNWELYRGMERIEAAVHKIAEQSVSAAVFAVEKQSLNLRIDTQGAEIAELRAQQLVDRQHLEAYQKEQEQQKGRNRLFVYGILLSPLAAVLIKYFFDGGFGVPVGG